MTDDKKITNNAECKELAIYTTIEPQILKENLSKIDITSTELYDLEDQQNEVELGSNNFDSVFNLMESLHTNNKDNNILNNMTLTTDIVTSSINNILIDLSNVVKVNSITPPRPEAQITNRDSVEINTTALINEVTNKNCTENVIKSTKLHDLDDQQKEVELESDNFKQNSNLENLLYANTKNKNIPFVVKPTKDSVMSAIDNLLIELNNDVKVELTTLPQPAAQKNHREGVRMNTTALRREMYIKNRLQKK
ncbi:hypothetical protein AGLY_001227 [Aphis glycines]|uniref:Uncharacterized protein n=1 Tax=Aphis glycines TaxID=307491 RepID=A0A6G0U9C9_APHGL|nr:hypothetical protein AGLY_001227 [Aphis glycines]